ncbi:MAG: hypothetical protein ACI9LM_002025 [Alteromonadaceae bacterium]|jgi:hypothetical protein
MITIIIGLFVALITIVVVVNGIQQHREKLEQEKRALAAKQKAIVEETEELIVQLGNLPPNPFIYNILNKRSMNAAKEMSKILPESKPIKKRFQDMKTRFDASEEMLKNQAGLPEETFILPENEQQLVGILQCIKKLRFMLKSERTKGALDPQTFSQQDKRLDAIQLKIGVESLAKRGNKAYSNEMLGSARQYFEKALQTLTEHGSQTEYTQSKRAEIEQTLGEITTALQSTNAADAAKKAKDEENDLDMLFQPKKKW